MDALGYTSSPSHSVPLGELPPPPPRVCFGRDELVEDIVGLAENHKPVALVGAAGIGKTSIALTVLDHNRIKERFGDNRRFIRCDRFPASCAHFLAQLSTTIGAGVKNPESLIPLRPFLSSREIILFLDNVESILDPQGTGAQEVYAVVKELSRFSNIFLGITSRIAIVPPHCERPVIPVLSMEAACNIFCSIYGKGGRSDVVNNLVQRLDYHALSITLLATTASHNGWDYDELAREWDTHRAQVLRSDYNKSLAATIELSLASPMFRKLGPDALALLEVIAFFPQGIDKDQLDLLFPTIPDRRAIFNKFCVLSLTHRYNDFFTMLAPIREYLCPRDPRSSPLLRATKDRYFDRLSAPVDPQLPNFAATRWIMSEDANVEHLIDVFISIDGESEDVWDACERFMLHLSWHKVRIVMLGSKIEALPDDHPSKCKCFFQLSKLFKFAGNFWEHKRLVTHLLELERGGEDGRRVAHILGCLADTNRILGFCKEGIAQAKEASEIFESLGDTSGRVLCLHDLACLLYQDMQLDAAKETAARALTLVPNEGAELLLCQSHHLLGYMCFSKGERGKAIHHFGVALRIASPSGWHHELGGIHYSLATLFLKEDQFENALDNVKKAQLHTVDSTFHLGRAMELEARIWYRRQRSREATAVASCALEIFEQLGAVTELEHCRKLLRDIGRPGKNCPAANESDFGGESKLIVRGQHPF